MFLPPHAVTSVTWESFDSLKVGSSTDAPPGSQNGAGTRLRRDGEGEEEEVAPPLGEDPALACREGPEGGNGTHGQEQRALRRLGFLDSCIFQPRWSREGWRLLGLTDSSSGKEPGDRGTSLAVSWEGHQEPAFCGDIAARREDPDFQGNCLCLPSEL